MTPRPSAVRLVNVTKTYTRGQRTVGALADVSLVLEPGELASVMGPSGSGKSTLLNLIAGLDVPTAGEIFVEDRSLRGLSDDQLIDLRRSRVGVVFQFFNLLPSISAVENVRLPLDAAGVRHAEAERRARAALHAVGLADRGDHLPEELSGGEMQRVAIARALVIEPAILLADEPTGNLDSTAGREILSMIRRCNKERGLTVLLVTHSAVAAAYADRVISLGDGRIEDDIHNRPAKEPPRLRPV
jgi:putative ABC transport system ATP-binding protein